MVGTHAISVLSELINLEPGRAVALSAMVTSNSGYGEDTPHSQV